MSGRESDLPRPEVYYPARELVQVSIGQDARGETRDLPSVRVFSIHCVFLFDACFFPSAPSCFPKTEPAARSRWRHSRCRSRSWRVAGGAGGGDSGDRPVLSGLLQYVLAYLASSTHGSLRSAGAWARPRRVIPSCWRDGADGLGLIVGVRRAGRGAALRRRADRVGGRLVTLVPVRAHRHRRRARGRVPARARARRSDGGPAGE